MRRLLYVLAASGVCSLPGCCTAARWFCGPDATPWVSKNWDSPHATLATLREALRRDQPEVVYQCLAQPYRQHLGLDAQSMKLAWERVRATAPSLHLVAYAQPPHELRCSADAASYQWFVGEHSIVIDLVAEPYWQVRYRRADGTIAEFGVAVAQWDSQVSVRGQQDPNRDRSLLTITPLPLEHEGTAALSAAHIESALLSKAWRIRAIEQRHPE